MDLTTFAQYYNHPMMQQHDYGIGVGGMIFSFLFFVLVFVSIMYFARLHARPHTHPHEGTHNETALDVAKKRYAAGEITKTEFEQIKKDLV